MENIQKDESLTPEAIEAEKEQLKETPEDEIRASIIEQHGLDEVEQSDLIDSLVKDKLADNKALRTAIGQKINWREKAQAPKEEKKPEEKSQSQPDSYSKEDIMQEVDKRMEQKELDSLDLSDELKQEVKTYAKVSGVSYKEALKSPYITFKKNEEDEKAKSENASISSSRKTMAKRDFSEAQADDFDLTTEQGNKDFDEFKKWLKSQ